MLDDHGLFEPELDKGLLARRKLVRPEDGDPADGLLRGVVKPDARTGLEPARRLLEQVELRIERSGRRKEAGAHDGVAARELVFLDSLEIHGRALARDRALGRLVMGLDAADLCFDPLGQDLDFLIRADRARKQGAGDDRAEAFHGEDAVDGQAQDAVR